MRQYCKINGTEYPAISFYGKLNDSEWDNRETKTITLEMTYAQAMSLFVDGCSWSIVDRWVDEVTQQEMYAEYDNSDFSIPGPLTDNRDGTLAIKMGKETDLEEAYELLYGGE